MAQPPDEFPQAMFEAAVEFAVLALRTLVLVNGAAVDCASDIRGPGLGQ